MKEIKEMEEEMEEMEETNETEEMEETKETIRETQLTKETTEEEMIEMLEMIAEIEDTEKTEILLVMVILVETIDLNINTPIAIINKHLSMFNTSHDPTAHHLGPPHPKWTVLATNPLHHPMAVRETFTSAKMIEERIDLTEGGTEAEKEKEIQTIVLRPTAMTPGPTTAETTTTVVEEMIVTIWMVGEMQEGEILNKSITATPVTTITPAIIQMAMEIEDTRETREIREILGEGTTNNIHITMLSSTRNTNAMILDPIETREIEVGLPLLLHQEEALEAWREQASLLPHSVVPPRRTPHRLLQRHEESHLIRRPRHFRPT